MRSIFKIHSITALAPTINRQSVDIFKADTAGPAPEPDTAAPFLQVAFSRDRAEQQQSAWSSNCSPAAMTAP